MKNFRKKLQNIEKCAIPTDTGRFRVTARARGPQASSLRSAVHINITILKFLMAIFYVDQQFDTLVQQASSSSVPVQSHVVWTQGSKHS